MQFNSHFEQKTGCPGGWGHEAQHNLSGLLTPLVFMVFFSTGALGAATSPVSERSAEGSPSPGPALAVNRVQLSADALKKYEKLEITADINASFANPYDTEEIEVWAEITDPQSKAISVPAFYYQDYEVNDTEQTITPKGSPTWKMRYTPVQTGEYTLAVGVKNKDRKISSGKQAFTVSAADKDARGFVRINPRHLNYYQFENTGDTFLPLGANMDIPEFTRDNRKAELPGSKYHGLLGDDLPGGSPVVGQTPFSMYQVYAVYKRTIEKLAANKANFLRVRLDSWWLPLEIANDYPVPGFPQGVPGFKVGEYNQYNAFLADKVLEMAHQEGLVVSFCTWNGHGLWGDSDYVGTNQGQKGEKFWDAPQWKANEALIKRRLRYHIARWSFSPNLLAYELFNEIKNPHVSNTNPFWKSIIDWMKELDPNARCVFNSTQGIDQEESHTYRSPQRDWLFWSEFYAPADKPYVMAEFGIPKMYMPEMADSDPRGLVLHEVLWGTLMGRKSGAVSWWLYAHIDWSFMRGNGDLYRVYYGPGSFLTGEDFGALTLAPATFALASGPGGMVAERGMTGDNTRGYLWFVRSPSNEKEDRTASDGNVYNVGDFKPGTYACQWWDTWSGTILKTDAGLSPSNGKICIHLPDGVTRDIAAKIIPQ